MNGEKQIEELAKDIKSWDDCYDENGDIDLNYTLQQHLYNLNYRKLPENTVVIPEKITEETSPKDIIKIAKYNEKLRKETARDFATKVKECKTIKELVELGYIVSYVDLCKEIDKLAKQYSVEVEE